jgi:hypothetical protein
VQRHPVGIERLGSGSRDGENVSNSAPISFIDRIHAASSSGSSGLVPSNERHLRLGKTAAHPAGRTKSSQPFHDFALVRRRFAA